MLTVCPSENQALLFGRLPGTCDAVGRTQRSLPRSRSLSRHATLRLWGGTLRYETRCEGDYAQRHKRLY